MLLAWILFLIILICAFKDLKRTIIVWSVSKVLFNAQIALFYSPGLALTVAVDVFLFLSYLGKCYNKEFYYDLNNDEPFFFRNFVIIVGSSFFFSMLFGISPISAFLNDSVKYFIGYFGSLFLLHKALNTREDIELFFKTVFVCAVLITSLGIFEAVFHDNPVLDYVYYNSPHNESTHGRMWYRPPGLTRSGDLQMRYGQVRVSSFFGIHIHFGCTCLYFLYFMNNIFKGLGGYCKQHEQDQKNIFFSKKNIFIVMILLVIGIFVSNSKTPIVGFFILLFALYEPKRILSLKILLPLIFLGLCVFLFLPSYLDNILSLFNEDMAEEGGGSKISTRSSQLDCAINMLKLNPIFGNGVGCVKYFKSLSLEYSDILGAESVWFRILPERGIYAGVIYLYFYVVVLNIFSKYVPFTEVFFLLLMILVMETGTGYMNMAIWLGMLIAVRRVYYLNAHKPKL